MGDTPKVGAIVEYECPDNPHDPVATGAVPLIVVNVADDGTYSGTAFLTDGSTRYVHVVPETPEEKAQNDYASLSDTDRQAFAAYMASKNQPAQPAQPADPDPLAGGVHDVPPAQTIPYPPQNGSDNQ